FGNRLLLGKGKLFDSSMSLSVGEPDFVFLGKTGENGPLHGEKPAVILKSEAHLFERSCALNTCIEPRVARDSDKGELRQQVGTRCAKLRFLRPHNGDLCKQV